jgi:hypothetical protein
VVSRATEDLLAQITAHCPSGPLSRRSGTMEPKRKPHHTRASNHRRKEADMTTQPTDQWDVIYSYTRKDAIVDGQQFLADEKLTKEAGLKWPVFITNAVFATAVVVPDGVEAQDVQGRLWDLLWMARQAINGARGDSTIEFVVHVRNDNRAPKPLTFYMQAGPVDVDDPAPAITMMAYEDL